LFSSTTLARSIAAGGLLLLLDQKQPKIKSPEMPCAQGLCPVKRAKPGLELFCPHPLCPAAKTPYALLPHKPPSFCPFLPEAVLLTHLEYETYWNLRLTVDLDLQIFS
jgi:hypothetical protein